MKPITIKFDVYSKDKKVARVEIVDGVLVKNEAYTDNVFEYSWLRVKDSYTMLSLLQTRIFDINRPDRDEILKILGLKEYNICEILKKTHGSLVHDWTWFKFDSDRKSLCWADICAEMGETV